MDYWEYKVYKKEFFYLIEMLGKITGMRVKKYSSSTYANEFASFDDYFYVLKYKQPGKNYVNISYYYDYDDKLNRILVVTFSKEHMERFIKESDAKNIQMDISIRFQ